MHYVCIAVIFMQKQSKVSSSVLPILTGCHIRTTYLNFCSDRMLKALASKIQALALITSLA